MIDTSSLSIGQLKEQLIALLPRDGQADAVQIDIVTFGFKYGIPLEADLVFDVRFLTNPYWVPDLKPLSGLQEPVREFVMKQPTAKRFLDLVAELLELTVPAYREEGRARLTVALGCTGGYHRSIALARGAGHPAAQARPGHVRGRLPPGAGAMRKLAHPALDVPGHAPEALAAAQLPGHHHHRRWAPPS